MEKILLARGNTSTPALPYPTQQVAALRQHGGHESAGECRWTLSVAVLGPEPRWTTHTVPLSFCVKGKGQSNLSLINHILFSTFQMEILLFKLYLFCRECTVHFDAIAKQLAIAR